MFQCLPSLLVVLCLPSIFFVYLCNTYTNTIVVNVSDGDSRIVNEEMKNEVESETTIGVLSFIK